MNDYSFVGEVRADFLSSRGDYLRVLAIETSARVGSLAVLEATAAEVSLLGEQVLPADQRSARSLVPSIQALLRDSDWRAEQLDLICVTSGPGSFTGLRLGVTTAKTLAFATGAQLAEVHTLSAIAAAVALPYDRLWAILDAQRQELFVAEFESGWEGRSAAVPNTRIVGVEQWLDELRTGDVVSGPPLDKITDRLPAEVRVAAPQHWSPRASIVGRMGIAATQSGHVVDAIQLVPRYYRRSAAEEKAEQR